MSTAKKKTISTFSTSRKRIEEKSGWCHEGSNSFNSDASFPNTKPFEQLTGKNEPYTKDTLKLFTSCFHDFATHPLSEGTKRFTTVKKYQNFKSKCRLFSLVLYIFFLLGITAKETTKSQDLNFIFFLFVSFGSYIMSILIGWLVVVVTLSRKHVTYSITRILKKIFYRIYLLHSCCSFTCSFVEDDSKHFHNTDSPNTNQNNKKNLICSLHNSSGNLISTSMKAVRSTIMKFLMRLKVISLVLSHTAMTQLFCGVRKTKERVSVCVIVI
jgi:hypothetical protein